jgi:type III secretion system needle length determinant
MDQNAARFSALLLQRKPTQRSTSESAAERTSRNDHRTAASTDERKGSASVSARLFGRREGRVDSESGDNPLCGRQAATELPPPQESAWATSFRFASVERAIEIAEQPTTALRTVDELVEAAAAAVDVEQVTGDSAVKLTIKDEVLPGVEIEIHRGDEGLKISVTASNAGSFDLLTEHADGLVERLNERLQQAVTVEIHFDSTAADFREPSDRNLDERGHGDERGDSNRRQRQRNEQ